MAINNEKLIESLRKRRFRLERKIEKIDKILEYIHNEEMFELANKTMQKMIKNV